MLAHKHAAALHTCAASQGVRISEQYAGEEQPPLRSLDVLSQAHPRHSGGRHGDGTFLAGCSCQQRIAAALGAAAPAATATAKCNGRWALTAAATPRCTTGA